MRISFYTPIICCAAICVVYIFTLFNTLDDSESIYMKPAVPQVGPGIESKKVERIVLEWLLNPSSMDI